MFSHEKLTRIEAQEAALSPSHTVVIVDDKSANLSVMAAILRPHYQVLEAQDGQEALALIEGLDDPQSVACVISDHRMPRMTGVELLEKVQALVPDAARIIVTGYIDVDALVDAINKAEVVKFIVKPFDANEFLAAVKQALEGFDERQEQSQRAARLAADNLALQARVAQLESQSHRQ